MSKVFFTSDTHFGHERIIELANRQYASLADMDESIVQAWNSAVGTADVVYHLGDFAFGDHEPYLTRLNGIKHLVRGNHDHRKRLKSAKGLWETISDISYICVDDVSIVLCHYAMRVWRDSHKGCLHFYGHSHGSLLGDRQSCDVGVDIWNRPVSLDTLRDHLSTFPPRIEPDHHARLEVPFG